MLALTACAGSSGGGGSGTASGIPAECPQPTGAYQAKYVKLGGTCGDLAPRVVLVDQPDDGCSTAYQHATPDGAGCKLEQRLRCASEDGTVTATITFVVRIPADVGEIRGTYSVDASGSGQGCSGSYDVTLTKL